MKTLISFILAFVIASIGLYGQTIEGRVVDNANNPVDYATIVQQTPDSVYLASTMTDTLGYFSLPPASVPYRLIVQHLLYDTKVVTVDTPDVGVITLDDRSHALGEVTVRGYRPAVAVENGKLSYDMPRLLEGKVVSNAYESLLELPGVREQDGHLVLAGANSLTVILNGKPSTMTVEQLTEILKNTPQSRILKVEVMYSAPPQYHVRGAAINLVLDGGTSEHPSWQGQVNTSYTQRTYHRANLGATLMYSSSRFSADLMYSFTNGQSTNSMELYSNHLLGGTVYDIEQFNRMKSHVQIHNIRLGTEYKLSENDKLSLTYTSQLIPSYTGTQRSNGTYSNSVNRKTNDSPEQMHNMALSYSSGFGLTTGVDYTYYTDKTMQDFDDVRGSENEQFMSHSSQEINRLKLYADQNHSLAKDWTLNYGGAFTYASDKSGQTYITVTGTDISDRNTSGSLREYTYNLYAGFEKKLTEKLSLSASLSGEYYKMGDFDQWSLFPSLEATYVMAPEHILQLSVSSDKDYPSYWEMQGAISYLNGYTEIHGNPSLHPSNDYTAQLSYIFRSKYVLTLYGSHSDNYFVQLPYQSPDRLALIYKTMNFDFEQDFGANLTLPFAVGDRVSSRLTVIGMYNRAKSTRFHDLSFDNSKWIMYTSLSNTFNISNKPNIKAELLGAYISPSIQGPGSISELWKVDAGLKWVFANDKAELGLKAVDIFDTWSPEMRLKYATQDIKMNVQQDSRALTLSFTYKFGGYKNKERKSVDTSRFGQQ